MGPEVLGRGCSTYQRCAYTSGAQVGTCPVVVYALPDVEELAAKCMPCGASFVAPLIGRLDDINADGFDDLARSTKHTFSTQGVGTRIVAALVRTPQSAAELFSAGCDIVTMPYDVLEKMLLPLTDAGLKKSEQDWKEVPA